VNSTWMLDVLDDLKRFSALNDMENTAQGLDRVRQALAEELQHAQYGLEQRQAEGGNQP